MIPDRLEGARTVTRLSQILPLSNIVLGLEASSKKRVFEQAGLMFENHYGIARSLVTENLFARERLGSTGLGHGVAVPHGRIQGLEQPMAALVRLQEAIPFESPDGQPVKLLIFLLIPEQVTQLHLDILSEIAEMFSDEAMRTGFLSDPDPAAVQNRLHGWQTSLQHLSSEV